MGGSGKSGRNKKSKPVKSGVQSSSSISDIDGSSSSSVHAFSPSQRDRLSQNAFRLAPPIQEEDLPQIFDEELAKTMSYEELLNMIIRHLEKHLPGNRKEAENYHEFLKLKIHELETAHENLREEHSMLQLQVKQEENASLKKQLLDQGKEIMQLKEQIHLSDNLQAEIAHLHQLNEKLSEDMILPKDGQYLSETLTPQVLTMNIEELRLNYAQALTKLTEQKETILAQNFQIEQKSHEFTLLLEHQVHQTKLHSNLQRLQEEESKQSHTKQHKLYADAVSSVEFNRKFHSNSAILLRRQNTKISMAYIRNLLNTHMSKDLPNILCTLSRDKNSFIIKTEKEEDIGDLADRLQALPALQDMVEVELRGTQRRKVVLLGVPIDCSSEEALGKINSELGLNPAAHIFKVIKRNNSKNYSLVLELDKVDADSLLKKKILLGFNVCKIAQYSPIIRCNKCQKYGHIEARCTSESHICAYCTGRHASTSCKNKDNSQEHKCINCKNNLDTQGRSYHFNHAANSGECYTYQEKLNARNQAQNSKAFSSRR